MMHEPLPGSRDIKEPDFDRLSNAQKRVTVTTPVGRRGGCGQG